MLQLYFLSVAVNLLAGTILSAEWLVGKFPAAAALTAGLSRRRSKLVVGLSAILVGFVDLVFPANPPIFLGDLVPSVAGLAMGVAMLFEVLRQEALLPAERAAGVEPPGRIPTVSRTALGMFGIVAALVHFFLPERLIL